MSSPFPQPSLFKNVAHGFLLLIMVPLLFLGIYMLVLETHDADEDTKPLPIAEKTKKYAKSISDAILPPPSGAAWLTEIDEIDLKLTDKLITYPKRKDKIVNIRQRLNILRDHINKYSNDVPPVTMEGNSLRLVLTRITNEITALSVSQAEHATVNDLEQQFETARLEKQRSQAIQIRDRYEEESQPMIAKHTAQLANLRQANRETQDRLQSLTEEADRKQRQVEEQLAKNARKKAFEPDRAEVQRLLLPFISPAYSQLGEYRHTFEKTAEAQPLSFSGLERLGAMEPTIKGLESLGYIGSSPYVYKTNTRPMGSFPIFNEFSLQIPTQLETIKRAQELLRKHSAYLIESGMLLP